MVAKSQIKNPYQYLVFLYPLDRDHILSKHNQKIKLSVSKSWLNNIGMKIIKNN